VRKAMGGGLAAAAVIAGLLLPAAGPAHATGLERHEPAAVASDAAGDTGQVRAAGEVEIIMTVVKAAYTAYKTFASGGLSVQEATNQILNAIYSAKIEIMARIDAVAAAQARACAQDAVLDFENFDVYSRDSQEAFAMAARSCVNLIDSLLATGPDKAAADQLGFALQAVGPIMLIVRSRIGVSNASMVPVLVRSTQAIINQLKPTCTSRLIEGRTQWTCVVYGSHRDGPEPSRSLAERLCQRRTSRPVANAVLPTLTSL
jgi:hypothetical protein